MEIYDEERAARRARNQAKLEAAQAAEKARDATFWARWTREYTLGQWQAHVAHNRQSSDYKHQRNPSPELQRACLRYRLPINA